MSGPFRIGQIVPSSNVTMETEIPAIFRARETIAPERFTFHSSRMRMKQVSKEELAAMDADAERCAAELSDAHVDVLGYACLVAIMSLGHGYHHASEKKLSAVTVDNGAPAPVVTSAGALVNALNVLGARKITLVCPYLRPLTDTVVDYIRHEGVEVSDYTALEIPDNLQVAAHDPGSSSRSRAHSTTATPTSSCCRLVCRCRHSSRSKSRNRRSANLSCPPRSRPRIR